MTDEEADRALRVLQPTDAAGRESTARQDLPSFVGSLTSGDGTLPQHTDDLLSDGFSR